MSQQTEFLFAWCSTVGAEQLITKEDNLTRVQLRSNESQDSLLRRFRKKVIRDRIMTEVRKRRWHMSSSERRRLAKKKAIRRMRRRERQRNR